MKVLTYASRTLIMQDPRPVKKEQIPDRSCAVSSGINISKRSFLSPAELYDLSDWRKLSHPEMYGLIFIMTRYDLKKTEED